MKENFSKRELAKGYTSADIDRLLNMIKKHQFQLDQLLLEVSGTNEKLTNSTTSSSFAAMEREAYETLGTVFTSIADALVSIDIYDVLIALIWCRRELTAVFRAIIGKLVESYISRDLLCIICSPMCNCL